MATVTSSGKKRIEWIDTAKGFCILLIVYNHVFQMYGSNDTYACLIQLSSFFDNFAVPSFYFISGFFFKTYDSPGTFIKNKSNRILIPFVLFYFFSCPIRVVFNIVSSVDHSFSDYLFDFYFNHCGIVNGPLWFLLSLFEVSIFHYIICIICSRKYLIGSFSLLIGIIGLILSYFDIQLPMTLSTSCTCLPFYTIGYFIHNYTNFLHDSPLDKYLFIFVVLSGLICFLTSGNASYYVNTFRNTIYVNIHICGVMGCLMILFLSKMIGRVPVISYMGHYSLVILCTHILIFKTITVGLRLTSLSVNYLFVFINVLIIDLMIIPLMIKYLPYMTAQKDLIK